MKEKTIERIRKFTEERDWDQFHSPANLAKSIVIEAAELLECFQSRSSVNLRIRSIVFSFINFYPFIIFVLTVS